MDCLSHYCIQLDFLEYKMRFLDPGRLGGLDLGKAFPIEQVRGCFFVNENIAGLAGYRSLIDTGCNFDGVLIPGLFRQWTNQPDSSAAAPVGQARYPDGVLGGFGYSNLCVADDGEMNLIGLHLLARNLVTLNFPGRTLCLQQRSAGPPPGEEGYFNGFYRNAFKTH
jgi:hypothetical protein